MAKNETWYCGIYEVVENQTKPVKGIMFRLHMPEGLLVERDVNFFDAFKETKDGYECTYTFDSMGNGKTYLIKFRRIPYAMHIYEREFLIKEFGKFHCIMEGSRFSQVMMTTMMNGLVNMLVGEEKPDN